MFKNQVQMAIGGGKCLILLFGIQIMNLQILGVPE
jgi:hypothetical protein